MRFEFRNVGDGHGDNRPSHHLADIDMLFDEPPFAGLKVIGLAVWARKNNVPGMAVSFPARVVESGDEEARFFPYIVAAKGSGAASALRGAILKAFTDQFPEIALRAGVGDIPSAPSSVS